jgi:hypothetical protein
MSRGGYFLEPAAKPPSGPLHGAASSNMAPRSGSRWPFELHDCGDQVGSTTPMVEQRPAANDDTRPILSHTAKLIIGTLTAFVPWAIHAHSRVRLRHLDTGRHGTGFQVGRCVELRRGSLELSYNDLALAWIAEAWTKTMMLRRGLASLAFAQVTGDRVGARLCKAPDVRERALGLSWAVSRMADL